MTGKKKENFRAGFVGIMGRPNVGKSTILNELVGYKVSIITPKPQTTRNRLLGIANYDNFQVAFVDTPGMHSPTDKLGSFMIKQIHKVISESDILLFVISAKPGFCNDDLELIKLINSSKKPTLFVLNKIDLIDKDRILSLLDEARGLFDFKEYVPISAKKKDNLESLISCIRDFLPTSEKLFPEEYITDSPEHFIASEIIREELLKLTHQEIPYSTAVVISEMSYRQKKDLTYISATIFIEKDSQKKIVIGHDGSKIKHVGKRARLDLEKFLGHRVYLELEVKVLPKWKRNKANLKKLGYDVN